MVRKTEVDITPDKSLIKKLGLVGYRTEQAIAELIDNSIDARIGGRTEHVHVGLDFGRRQITVTDDGRGMDLGELKDALTVAKETKDEEGDGLGQFGLGMKSACSSLGKSFTVTTTKQGRQPTFTARYDEDQWLGDGSRDWSNFEIEEAEEGSKHGTRITISNLKVPLYPNQLSNFRRRFGIRYGPYLKNGQIRISVGSRDCEAVEPELEEGTRRSVDIKLSSGRKMVGWIGLLKRRSIKGDYGIHIYRRGRLIRAFDKFGIRRHPEVAKIIGKISLDHVPVNFHKTGFLEDSLEYKEAFAMFKNDPTVAKVLRSSSSQKTGTFEIRSVLEYDPDTVPDKPIDTRMSAANAKSLLDGADNMTIRRGPLELDVEFESIEEGIYQISCSGNKARVAISKASVVFKTFKNPLFLLGLIRIEAELVACNPSKYADFVVERNRRWVEFIDKFLPKPETRNGRMEERIVPMPNYSLEAELVELHDHLKERFVHDFQFTGLSTLFPFLQNAYSKIIYNVQAMKGAGQELLEIISDHSKEITVLLNPKPFEVETVLKVAEHSRFMIIREYAERLSTTWATPEKAWLDLYIEVNKKKVTMYRDELAAILAELLESNLIDPKKLRSLAKHRNILGEIETCMEEGE
ncbi:MAG: ATP-binding protein [Nitrosopumilaceae archaeon]|nr:ATP-binding protein [Nitrosopumilaceae archaeon]